MTTKESEDSMNAKTVATIAAGTVVTGATARIVRAAIHLRRDGELSPGNLAFAVVPMKFPLGTTDGPRDHELNPQDYDLHTVVGNSDAPLEANPLAGRNVGM